MMNESNCCMNHEYENRRSAVRGSMIGGAIGDALGYPVEFKSLNDILCEYGSGGIQNYKEGKDGLAEISDDTQMALYTANGLLVGYTRGGLRGIMDNPESYVYKAYKDWYGCQLKLEIPPKNTSFLSELPEMHEMRAPGNTCMSALSLARAGMMDEPINHSKGCGGIMRAAPAALFYGRSSLSLDEISLVGAKTAALTHGHPLGYMPAAALVYILHRAAFGGCPGGNDLYAITQECMEAMERILEDIPARKQMLALMALAVELSGKDESDADNIRALGEGWTAEETLAIALYCSLKYQNDFSRAVIASVNHSGDSDSTGAVTGNIVGALVGMEGIEEKWLKNLELRDVILEVADDLATGCHHIGAYKALDPVWEYKYINHHVFPGYDLQRFLNAQEGGYAQALEEIRSGYKCSCWMWYIFPQLKFLGRSDKAKYFGLLNLTHARLYLKHPLLGMRLREISQALLQLDENDPLLVMGDPDHLKLCSCMTLFDFIENDGVFAKVLDKYYGGKRDEKTLKWLKETNVQ